MRQIRAVRTVISEIEQALLKRGVIGSIRWFGRGLLIRTRKTMFHAHKEWHRSMIEAEQEFDLSYGVETCSQVRLSQLNIPGNNWRYGNKYEALTEEEFNRVLCGITPPYEDHVFVDLGSGKGRAIVLASVLPFKKVVGVEFSGELTAIAKRNLYLFPPARRKCQDIEVLCLDAVENEFPTSPIVLFLNNPFSELIMVQVVRKLTTSFYEYPREIVVAYLHPEFPGLWDEVEFLRRVKAARDLIIWRSDEHFAVSE